MKKQINVGLIGLGTVGTGVLKIFNNMAKHIEERAGAPVIIKKIVTKDASKAKDVKFDKSILSKNLSDILEDDSIDIVVELIGGYEPALSVILKSMENKKHVVTANKAVLAKYWDKVHSIANLNRTLLYFEASVGGGIPVIQGLNEGLVANKIDSIYGILNGTTNYILTKMLKENLDFSTALKMAQKIGFAEADPSFDIKGIDSAHKLGILANIAYGETINLEKIYTEGIDKINLEDISYAKEELGLILKLLGITKRHGNKIEVRVQPTFIPEDHLLASVDDEYNAIYIEGDNVGKTMFYGRGAGELPAASAVVSDIIYVARQIYNETAGILPLISYSENKKLKILDMDDIESKYYLRFSAVDKPGVLSKIAGELGKHNVSIDRCVQKKINSKYVPIILSTHKAKEKNIRRALSSIEKLSVIKREPILIRIEDEL
jgi:homoserine dehydrogenase